MVLLLIAILAELGCSFTTPDCRKPEVFCVGLVTQVGRLDDGGANQAAWGAIQQARTEGLATKVATIETVDSRDYKANIQVLAEAGYDVVVTVGNNAEAATYAVSGQYANVYFIGADQPPLNDQVNLPNLTWLIFPEEHMGFLAGAMAAEMTQTGKVGAVCASDALAQMKSYGDGFLAGVIYTKPQVRATVSYHNEVDLDASLNDPSWGEAAADSLINEGADIIFAVGGTTAGGALESAGSRGVYVVGAEFDQYLALPATAPCMLTSILKLISPGVENLLSAAKIDQENHSPFRTGTYYGQIDFAPYHELSALIPDEVKQLMADLPQTLLSGEIHLNELIPAP